MWGCINFVWPKPYEYQYPPREGRKKEIDYRQSSRFRVSAFSALMVKILSDSNNNFRTGDYSRLDDNLKIESSSISLPLDT